MKTLNSVRYTKGFFDLGIALIILALGGTASYVKVSQDDDTVVTKDQKEQVEQKAL